MKFIKQTFLVLSMLLALLSARPSGAIVGVATGNPGLVLMGIAFHAGSAAGNIYQQKQEKPSAGAVKMTFWGAILGLVMLDDGQRISFQNLSTEEATQVGLTDEELKSYNSELDQVNALVSHVGSELSQLSNPTEKDSAAIWESVKTSISPETFSALQKIVTQK